MEELNPINKSFLIKELTNIYNIKKTPKHIAISLKKLNNENMDKILEITNICIELDIPILTFNITKSEHTSLIIEFLEQNKNLFHEKKIKISILGKWYSLQNKIVESIKEITSSTKDYDNFFLNLCINYNGNEEIINAMKIIARQLEANKISIENIDNTSVKDNIYSSFFIPPDIIILPDNNYDGTLLWDSPISLLYINYDLNNLNIVELMKIINDYNQKQY